MADQVRAGNVAPNAAGRIPADALLAKGLCRQDDIAWHDEVLEDLLAVVEVIDEEVQRVDALLEALFQAGPLGGRDDARHDVEGEDLLQPRLLPIDIESDAHLHQGALGAGLPGGQFAGRQRLDGAGERRDDRAWFSAFSDHLIEESFGVVAIDLHR